MTEVTMADLLAAQRRMRRAALDSPLGAVITYSSVEALRPATPMRLHLTLEGSLPVAALLGDAGFRTRLEPLLDAREVERAVIVFTRVNLANLSFTVTAHGVDLGTAVLLEEVVREYVSRVRYRAETAGGLHDAPAPSEAEVAASSSLNRASGRQVWTSRGAVRLGALEPEHWDCEMGL